MATTQRERSKLRALRRKVVQATSVNSSGSKIEHLANLFLIEDFNRRVRKFKRSGERKKSKRSRQPPELTGWLETDNGE